MKIKAYDKSVITNIPQEKAKNIFFLIPMFPPSTQMFFSDSATFEYISCGTRLASYSFVF